MPQQIIRTNFHFDIPNNEFETVATSVAKQFEAVTGLQWKIFLLNEERKEAGGMYLFVNKNAMTNFKTPNCFMGLLRILLLIVLV